MMSKLKAILIDDEIACTETLDIELRAYCPEVEVISKCNSAQEGLKAIQQLNPDLVFLDIEMPWMNGFELLEELDDIPFHVIFVTAYDQFAIKAFKYSAVDYLLKPIDKQELIESVRRVKSSRERYLSSKHLKILLSNMQNDNHLLPNIALPTMEGLDFVAVKDILYCESDNNYTRVHRKEGKVLLLSKSLKEIEKLLKERTFFRVHQSYLVNLTHITRYIKGSGGFVVLSNGDQVPVSRAKKEELLRLVRHG